MKLIPLPFETRATTGYTHKAIVTFADLVAYSGGSTTSVVPLLNARVGDVVEAAAFALVTAFDFSDTGIDSCTMAVGDDGSTGRFIDAQQLAVDGTEITYYAGNAVATPLMPYAYKVANAIDALFTVATGGSPLTSEATVGEVHIYLRVNANLAELNTIVQPSAT
jgi:hypothetical protein